MIVQADFLTHWKTRALAGAIGEESALRALLSLWAHCQTRRAWEFRLNDLMLAGMCSYTGQPALLWETMIKLNLIEDVGEGWYQVHDWGEINSALVGQWAGGAKQKGVRWHPRGYYYQPQVKPQVEPEVQREVEPGVAPIGLDRIGEDRNKPLPPDGGVSQLALGDQPKPPPSSRQAPVAKKKKGGARERNPVFDAMLVACGMPMTGLTGPEQGRVVAALRDIREAMPDDITEAALVAEIGRRASRYKAEWPRAELTPTALSANWNRFGEKNGARVVQGVAEPTWDWRTVAARLGLQVENWAMLERADKVRVIREQVQEVKP